MSHDMEEKGEIKQEPKGAKSCFVKWFNELSKDSVDIAGVKGANLAELYNAKMTNLPGFVVTTEAYKSFISGAGISDKINELLSQVNYEDIEKLAEISKEIMGIILNAPFPKDVEEDILESYDALDVKEENFNRGTALDILKNAAEPPFVAVRPSVLLEDFFHASYAGQQSSFLNLKGNYNLLEGIKRCFASLFSAKSIFYSHKKGLDHSKISIAVVIQRMVDSRKSGVVFSKDPSYESDNFILEAVWGSGDGIVEGNISPDCYIVSPENKVIGARVPHQKVAFTRSSSGSREVKQLSEEQGKAKVLSDSEIIRICELAKKIEEYFGSPQNIEFAIESDSISILQTRPITTFENRRSYSEASALEGEVLLKGLGSSPGIVAGKLRVVEKFQDLSKVSEGDILVANMTSPELILTMDKTSGIITDEGGITSHLAILAREFGIPLVVGTVDSTKILVDGEVITLDGYTGRVYRGKISESFRKEVKPVEKKTNTEIKVIVDLPSFAKKAAVTGLKKIGLSRVEGIIAENKKHPLYYLQKGKLNEYEDLLYNGLSKIVEDFNEIWVKTSDIRSDEYRGLEGALKEAEANPMMGFRGIRFGLKNPEILKAEMRALKRISEDGKVVGIMFPRMSFLEELIEAKKLLHESGCSNIPNLKFGIILETPIAVQLIKDFCEEGIDFVSIGLDDLAQYMLAIDRENPKVQHLFNEAHPGILYQLGFVIRVCKKYNVETSLCGHGADKKDIVKFLIEKEIDSICVDADVAADVAIYVEELERELGRNKVEDLHEEDLGETDSEAGEEDDEEEEEDDEEDSDELEDEEEEDEEEDIDDGEISEKEQEAENKRIE